MDIKVNSRRSFFGKVAGMAAAVFSASSLWGRQALAASASATPTPGALGQAPAEMQGRQGGRRGGGLRGSHTHNGIYYISGTGANDGYGRNDHVLVTDPFEKHVTRTMDALKKSVERAGSNMDSIMDLHVFICLPIADGVPVLTGKARFDAYQAAYEALNKIYGTYFSPGKAPARSCMALDWIPGDSLLEVAGTAMVVNPPAPAAGA